MTVRGERARLLSAILLALGFGAFLPGSFCVAFSDEPFPSDVRVVSLCPCLGDMNSDLIHNGKDIQQFVKCLLGPSMTASPCFCADMNSDGFLTLADIASFVTVILNGSACTQSTTGACCLPGNTCINTTLLNCSSQGGTFQGQGIPCSPGLCTPTGACCAPNGTCTQTTGIACSQPSVYHGDGSNCGTVNCMPMGACCQLNGTCTQTTAIACSQPSTYHGDGSNCASIICVPMGACCPPSGFCFMSTSANCIYPQIYQGDGTECVNVFCTPNGACCQTDGSCIQVQAALCMPPSMYQGDGTDCAFVICTPIGACCIANICVEVTEAACASQGGIYLGDGTSCAASVCPPPNPCPALPVPPNPLNNGPHHVGRLNDFNFPNFIGPGGPLPGIPASILEQDGLESSGGFTIGGQDAIPGYDVSGRIMYPATMDGVGEPVDAGGPFPIVIIAHGNHRRFADAVGGDPSAENFAGYSNIGATYLQELLATRGFISYSIDLDDFTFLAPGIVARAWVVLCSVEFMETLNGLAVFAGDPNPLQGEIDIDNVSLIGHSRGGEAVVQAVRMNAAAMIPGVGPGVGTGSFNIRSVWGIASTRFFDGVVNYDVSMGAGDPLKPVIPSSVLTDALPFMGMWGDADGDVTGNDFNSSLAFHVQGTYDGSEPGPKQFVWIYGANHNAWNRSWTGDDGAGLVPNRITAAQQRDIAMAYGASFFEGYINGTANFLNYFRFAANQVPPVAIAGTNAHLEYQPVDADREVIDSYEANCALATSSEGTGGVGTATLTNPVEGLLIGAAIHAAPANDPPPCAAARNTQSWYHLTRGLLFNWTANTNHYDQPLAAAQRDVSGFDALSFRVAQDRRDPNINAAMFIDVQLTDNAGRTAVVRTNVVTNIPRPQVRADGFCSGNGQVCLNNAGCPAGQTCTNIGTLTKSILKTVRIRLCEFKNVRPALNLANITEVRFIFSQRAAGQAAIDDIEFVNN